MLLKRILAARLSKAYSPPDFHGSMKEVTGSVRDSTMSLLSNELSRL